MADKPVEKQASKIVDADGRQHDVPLEEPLPGTNDPGGAHTKGYSAEPRPEPDVQAEGALPLASVPEGESHVQQPERCRRFLDISQHPPEKLLVLRRTDSQTRLRYKLTKPYRRYKPILLSQ